MSGHQVTTWYMALRQSHQMDLRQRPALAVTAADGMMTVVGSSRRSYLIKLQPLRHSSVSS